MKEDNALTVLLLLVIAVLLWLWLLTTHPELIMDASRNLAEYPMCI